VFGHALDAWRTAEELSFGFLVTPIVLALLWHRRAALRCSRSTGSGPGLIALISGLLLLLVSNRTGIHVLAGISFLPGVVGLTAYLYGITAARLVLFPVALQAVSLSLYRGLLDQVGFTLQGWTAHGATLLATLIGVPVRRSGLDLFVGDQHFVVAQACSGMDSLLALLCLGAVFVGLTPAAPLRRVILMTLVLPIILLANVVRVTLVLALSRPLGAAVTTGAGHHGLDALLFLIAALLFYAAGLSLRCAPRFGATSSSSR